MKSTGRSLWLVLVMTSALTACGGDDAIADTTIAAVLSSPLGTRARIEGVVTVPAGRFNSATGELGFAILDASSGIYVTTPLVSDLPLGTAVRLDAELQIVNTQLMLAPVGPVEKVAGSVLIEPQDTATGAVDESAGGKLVRVRGSLTRPIQSDLPYGYIAYIDDCSGEAKVFVHVVLGNPVIDINGLTSGDAVQVTGFVFKYDNVLEVAPRQASDLVRPAVN
jgi:hypothetical protein